MTLILRNHEIVGLMGLDAYIEAVEHGYREFGQGRGDNLPRHNVWLERSADTTVVGGHLPPGRGGAMTYKGAALPGLGGAGLQVYTWGVGQSIATYLLLFDTITGELTALMEVLYYDWLKTAAVSAVASRHLAPAGSRVAALYGTGRHARSQLHALCQIRPLERIQAYSRTPERLHAFCEQLTRELQVEVRPASSARAALTDADIITTMTTSPEPVFSGDWLEPERPVHINAMGAHEPWVREVDERVVLGSRVVVDEWEQAMREQGAILIPLNAGRYQRSEVYADLGQIVAGRAEGRTPTAPWTLFLSGGTGVEDVAVATHLLARARAAGVGTELAFNLPYSFDL